MSTNHHHLFWQPFWSTIIVYYRAKTLKILLWNTKIWLKADIRKETLKREIYKDNLFRQHDIFVHLLKKMCTGKDHIKIDNMYKNVSITRMSPFHVVFFISNWMNSPYILLRKVRTLLEWADAYSILNEQNVGWLGAKNISTTWENFAKTSVLRTRVS